MTITAVVIEEGGVVLLEGTTPEQVVGLLWKQAFIQEATPWEYMGAVAGSVKVYSGADVRTDTARHFLADLAAAHVLEVEWGKDDEEQDEV